MGFSLSSYLSENPYRWLSSTCVLISRRINTDGKKVNIRHIVPELIKVIALETQTNASSLLREYLSEILTEKNQKIEGKASGDDPRLLHFLLVKLALSRGDTVVSQYLQQMKPEEWVSFDYKVSKLSVPDFIQKIFNDNLFFPQSCRQQILEKLYRDNFSKSICSNTPALVIEKRSRMMAMHLTSIIIMSVFKLTPERL